VLNIIFPDRDSKESRYYGRKSGRSLSFVASSPLDKDAKFFNKRISTIEILEKLKTIHLPGCIRKVLSLKCRNQRFQQKKKDLNVK
jgi:hypothetical protein